MHFSIVIPTRNRPEYLPGTVRSALRQIGNYNFEVIVFDNASLISAKEVLKEIEDPRLSIKRSETPLAMRDSWELAISYATGDYLTVLGDDDSIVPSAVHVSGLIVDKYKAKILRWDRAHYYWPNYKNTNSANLCKIPLGKTLFKINGHWLLNQLGKMRLSYSAAPTIYNSWIHRDLVQKVKTAAGRLFHSASPDVDSGFAFAFSCDSFYHLNFPLSICAQSAKSNGAQMHSECGGMSEVESLEVADDYIKLNRQASIEFDTNPVETVWGGIATSYSIMAKVLHVPNSIFKLDKAALFIRVLQEEFPKMTLANKQKYLNDLESEYKRDPKNLMAAKRFVLHSKLSVADSREISVKHRPQTGYEEHLRHLTLDCSLFSVENAEQAAVLVDNVLGLNDRFNLTSFDWYPKSRYQIFKDAMYKLIRCRDFNFRGTQYNPGI